MNSARSRANHKLYLARIVLAAWREALQREDIARGTLSQAFRGAVSSHLFDAYGWLLLALAGVEDLPRSPPRSCADLPEVAPGRAVPGEIRELQQLEAGDWLAVLTGDESDSYPETPAAAARPGQLPVTQTDFPGPEPLAAWADQLEALMQRMGDSLDEY